ncbi:TetR/AcrR family transcriptional regulator [Acidaminobacter sp. JC074]|uniref:TetR/AcrR family transcriptional regulator n=1 Tax=Acidaminobacter sp. JC074 TaxID=2530199 RepID=UPI001F10C73A|nr:TetR/AcrR family transcriptional regulator [Acidaminobacter sp. JC074]
MAKYNREVILETGLMLLMKSGYTGLGIQNVLKACNIPKGSFYNFFPSKLEFVTEVLDLYNMKIEEALKDIDKQQISPYDKVVHFFKLANQTFFMGEEIVTCPMLNVVADEVLDEASLLTFIDKKFKLHKSYLEKWIEEGQRSGVVKNQITPQELADMIYDIYHGIVYRSKYSQSRDVSEVFVMKTLPFVLK